MSDPLPVIDIVKSVTTIQTYLRSATNAALPPVIADDEQYSGLVTQFVAWQQDLWEQFWEGLLSAGIVAQSVEIDNLFDDEIDDEGVMHGVLYDGTVPLVASQCDDVAGLINRGEPLLAQLEAIAEGIEDADKAAVERYTSLVATLQAQFGKQEDELTQKALDSATDVVATGVEVMLAVGTEGEASAPLAKGVVKIGTDVVDELVLTDEINDTLSSLEAAWTDLDQASADLAQITLACNQLKAVTEESAGTLAALNDLSKDWTTVAQTTNAPADEWSATGSSALQSWAAQMVKLTYANAQQTVTAS